MSEKGLSPPPQKKEVMSIVDIVQEEQEGIKLTRSTFRGVVIILL